MSDPVVKGVKRSLPRPASHSSSAAKNRKLTNKSARPKPVVKRSAAEKAPVRKATKSKTVSASSGTSKTAKTAAKSKRGGQKQTAARTRTAAKSAAKSKVTRERPAVGAKKSAAAAPAKVRSAKPKITSQRAKPPVVSSRAAPAVTAPRQPTRDEAAALRAFERAHKEFTHGRFAEARTQFRALIEQFAGAAEVTARARTYLAIAEARMRTESALPRDADALYDRGVIELNRGEYVAAQEMFERALKREPEAAHIHYGLASARARLGSIGSALESLERALDLQPNLRVRAQRDLDLAPLRNEPDFERMVFTSR